MTLRQRIASTIASLAAAGAVAFAPGTASAIPACPMDSQCSYVFYATSARDDVVGGWTEFCDGTWDRWGTRTSYLEFHSVPCN